ncbi:MAG: hypothetical protein AAFY60_12720, partial [Myxococcota bacterium]
MLGLLVACGGSDEDDAPPSANENTNSNGNGNGQANQNGNGGSDDAGCTDGDAANFDDSATRDDGSCVYQVTFTVDASARSDELFVTTSGAAGESRASLGQAGAGPSQGSLELAPGAYSYRFELGSQPSARSPVRRFEVIDAPLVVDGGVFSEISAALPLIVSDHFFPDAFFPGDGDQSLDGDCPNPPEGALGECYRFSYAEAGGEAFAGVLWSAGGGFQTPQPSVRVDPGAQTLQFMAWGESGGERVEFGVKPNDEANNPQQLFTLSTTPTVYTVNFSALSYDRVLFPFLWAATADENPSPITFYVTDIQWLDETSGAGCTDPNAKNYASTASEDDGSCLYDLTFTVDMACPDAVNGSDEAIGEVSGFTNVAITGPLFGFSGEIN